MQEQSQALWQHKSLSTSAEQSKHKQSLACAKRGQEQKRQMLKARQEAGSAVCQWRAGDKLKVRESSQAACSLLSGLPGDKKKRISTEGARRSARKKRPI